MPIVDFWTLIVTGPNSGGRVKAIIDLGLEPETLEDILHGNARKVYKLDREIS